MRPSKKTLAFGIPVVLLWGAATATLIDRSRAPQLEVTFDPSQRIDSPTDSWLILFAGKKEDAPRIGYVHLQQIPEAREGAEGISVEGVRLELVVHMTLEIFGRSTELDISGHAWRPWQGERADFAFRMRSAASSFALEGQIVDDRLDATVTSAGESIPLTMTLRENALFSTGFGSALSFPVLEIGDEVRLDTFDPMTLRSSQATVRCVAQQLLEINGEVIETKVLRVDSGGLKSRAWVDDHGEVVRAETAMGLTLERSTAEAALAPISESGGGGEFLRLTSIRPTGSRPFRGAEEMTFKVSGHLPSEGLPVDGTQRRIGASGLGQGSSLTGRRYQISTRGRSGGQPPEDLSVYLEADAFAQSDHPTLRAASEDILRNVDDQPAAKARAIHDWVYTKIDKEAVLSIPSALEVLEQRRGDCNEHTILYTALARAAGLPTRIAIGIVWSDVFGGFYYHAWPEVWIEDRWHWNDPTLGQPAADATHVKLLNGGIESWPRLLPYLGQLEIEVLEIR